MTKRSCRLRVQALAGLLGFLLLFAGFSALQLRAMRIAEENHRVLGELSLLETSLMKLLTSAANYAENAPRDYASYDRDVLIYLHDLRLELTIMREELATLDAAFENRVGQLLPGFGGDAYQASLAAAMAEATSVWSQFESGLAEKLGPDESEPRLEWGAEFIEAELPGVDESLMGMAKQYRMVLDRQTALSGQVVNVTLIVLLILGAGGVAWFYRRVIRRIGQASDGCLRVANGDFGYTLPVAGRDEISDLSRAFNSLSNRSELVVRMLSSLQQATGVEQALSAVVNASGSYLPIAWVGLALVDRQRGSMEVVRALPTQTLSNWPQRRVGREQTFGRELEQALLAREPVIVNDLRERAAGEEEGEFLRGLVRATQLEALVALPLASPLGWEGLLLFGSRSTRYETHQTDLLNRLAPTLALSFQRTASALAQR